MEKRIQKGNGFKIMSINFFRAFLIFYVIFLSFSCRTPKNVNYFVDNEKDSTPLIYKSYDVPIQPGDELSISVSALNTQAAVPYNAPSGKSLVVDPTGVIVFPILGNIQAAGLTRNQLRDGILMRLKTYLTDPSVTVDFSNFKVSVLGEVNHQGTFPVSDGRINVLEAIALAGDLTKFGKKNAVTVIRERNGIRQFGSINLQSTSVFSSPFYRLQQNDIVYVQSIAEKPTVRQENFTRNFSLLTSVFGIVSGIAFIIISLNRY